MIVKGCQQECRAAPHLSRVRRVLEVVGHLYRLSLVRELDEGLVSVGAHIELGLHQAPEGRGKFSQLLICRLVRQVPNVQHLQPSSAFHMMTAAASVE